MFSKQRFEVFHDGYWYGQKQPSPPTWYLFSPALNDTREIVEWKIGELGLPVREEGRPGRGSPVVGASVVDSILITTYSKREIDNFLSALNVPTVNYDFKSTQVFQPKSGYEASPLYWHYIAVIRRSVKLRSQVRGWLK